MPNLLLKQPYLISDPEEIRETSHKIFKFDRSGKQARAFVNGAKHYRQKIIKKLKQ